MSTEADTVSLPNEKENGDTEQLNEAKACVRAACIKLLSIYSTCINRPMLLMDMYEMFNYTSRGCQTGR